MVEIHVVLSPLTAFTCAWCRWGTKRSHTPLTWPMTVVGKGLLASRVLGWRCSSFKGSPPLVVVLMLLVELRHLKRRDAFPHHQKVVSFLSQLHQQQMFIVILEFGSQARRKALEGPVSVHGIAGAAGGLFDPSQPRDPGTSSLVPSTTAWHTISEQLSSVKPLQPLREWSPQIPEFWSQCLMIARI